MKKIKVIVKDKTVLELIEDAKAGDLIDLKEVVEVDTSYLDAIIESGKDKVYASKLEEVKKTLNAENRVEINRLLSNIDLLKKENASALALKEKDVEQKYLDKIAELNKKIEVIESTKKSEMEALSNKNEFNLSKLRNEEDRRYSELNQKYQILLNQNKAQSEKLKLELETEYNKKINELVQKHNAEMSSKNLEFEKLKSSFKEDKDKALSEQKANFEETIKEKVEMINNLQRAKASMNVKQTGEDLEAWCDNEVNSYMQNGLFNCTWTKDNKAVKEEDEVKGSKADYILKVYASEKHNEDELITSVCMDMKDENPDSTKKKKNADYYKQLDKNREKKNCKYAILVSNLEMDKPNTLPIFKVREYGNMYVVRPAYLMVFLNMIVSLTTRFAELILSKEAEKKDLKNKLDLINKFDEIKKTYLDKPLELLEKNVEEIIKSSESIQKAAKNIDEQCEKINKSYITQINEKINKFDLKLTKEIIKHLPDESN